LFLANLVSALAVRRVSGRHLIVSQRCSYEATAGRGWRWVARWSHRRADCVIVNSRAALEEEAAAGHPRSRLVYIPNGVGEPAPPPANRSALGLPAGALVICVGQLEYIKGHHVLVEAWPAVGAAVPGAQLVLVGTGPQRGALEERARSLGVSSTIAFAGFRPRARPLMASADVFVQPSLTEGMPNAVLEAMAASRPVVASSVGGIPELIVDGESGILVPPADPHALAAAVARLLVDRALAVRLATAAAKRARDRFSLDRVVSETGALYRALLDGRETPAMASPKTGI
jgi:glycosyltransferase involved in cell wall biosynthesis